MLTREIRKPFTTLALPCLALPRPAVPRPALPSRVKSLIQTALTNPSTTFALPCHALPRQHLNSTTKKYCFNHV
jgi:hypothetical protein